MKDRVVHALVGGLASAMALSFACGSPEDGSPAVASDGGADALPGFSASDAATGTATDAQSDASADAAGPLCVPLTTTPLPASPIAWSGTPACALDGFCTLHPSPTGTRPYRIGAAATSSVWAVAGDVAYHWVGASGQIHKVPVGHDLTSIAVISDTDVWATGYESTVAHFDGTTWTTDRLEHASALSATYARATDDVWTVGNFGVVGHFDGATWTSVQLTGSPSLTDVWATTDDVWATARSSGGVWHYDGAWTKVSDGTWNAVWGSGPDDVWLVGESGLLRGSAASLNPEVIPTANQQRFDFVWGTSATDVWVANKTDAHHWNGSTWTKHPGIGALGITGRSPTDVFAFDATTVKHWDGAAWSPVFTYAAPALRALWRGDEDVWAVGAKGTVLRVRGDAIEQVSMPAPAEHRAVWGSSTNDVWIVGDGDVAFHSDGSEICTVTLPANAQLAAISGSGPNDVWAVGPNGSAMHWNGSAWQLRDDLENATSILAFAPNDVWAAGAKLLHWDGTAWSEAAHDWTAKPDETFGPLGGSGPNDVWSTRSAFLEGTKVIHFDGTSWTTTPESVSLAHSISAVTPTDVWVFDWHATHLGTSGWARDSSYPRMWMTAAVVTASEIWYVGDNGELGRKTR